MARERLPHMVFEYIAGGAGEESTLRANRSDFERIRLRPRVLADVSHVDTSFTLFGETYPFPILLAPAAYQRMMHPEGELETARAAKASGAVFVVSTSSSTSVEDVASAGDVPWWFQLYASKDRGFTGELVRRAEAAGSKVLCFTVDAPIRGIRDRDVRASFRLPPGLDRPNLRGLSAAAAMGNPRPTGRNIYSPNLDPSLDWKDLEWLASFSRTPVLVKGVLTAQDSLRSLDCGAAGVIVSNHGARTVDTVPSAIEALAEIAPAVAGRAPLLLDSGIRRGSDVVKAIALGSSAVMMARPYLYALAVAGAAGVERVVEILRTELEMTMAICGRTSLTDIDSEILW